MGNPVPGCPGSFQRLDAGHAFLSGVAHSEAAPPLRVVSQFECRLPTLPSHHYTVRAIPEAVIRRGRLVEALRILGCPENDRLTDSADLTELDVMRSLIRL